MSIQDPTVRTVDADEASRTLSEILDSVSHSRDRFLVERDGKPVAAVVSTADLQRLARLDAQRTRAFDVVHRMSAAFEDVPFEEIEREAAKALAEVRAEMQAEREKAAKTTDT